MLAFKPNKARKQEVGHCDLILLWIFVFILIILKIKVQLMPYTKFRSNKSSGSKGKVELKGLAIFTSSGHF